MHELLMWGICCMSAGLLVRFYTALFSSEPNIFNVYVSESVWEPKLAHCSYCIVIYCCTVSFNVHWLCWNELAKSNSSCAWIYVYFDGPKADSYSSVECFHWCCLSFAGVLPLFSWNRNREGGHWGRSVLSQLEEEAFFSLGPVPGPAVYLPPWAQPLPAYWKHYWPQVRVSLCRIHSLSSAHTYLFRDGG